MSKKEYKLIELKKTEDIVLFKYLTNKYNPKGLKKAGDNPRYFVLTDNSDMWYVLILIDNADFRVIERFRKEYNVELNPWKCVFIRRITTLPAFWGSELPSLALKMLCEQLKNEGYEMVYSYSLPRHSGALYKHADFERGWRTRSRMWFYYKLLK